MSLSRDVYIIGYKRSPFGVFGGSLSTLSACQIASHPLRALVEEHSLRTHGVDGLIMGQALPAGAGQCPTAQLLSLAGLPTSIPSFSVNKVCASGMKAVCLATDMIRLGQADCIVAGGMEAMSQAPFYLPLGTRFGGVKYGEKAIVDGCEFDGLVDGISHERMGLCGERLASTLAISREEQDAFARRSFDLALQSADLLRPEIVPVTMPDGSRVEADEQLKRYNPEKMAKLKPAFLADGGTVTAANSSPMNDGAAILLLASAKAAAANGWKPLARVVAHADAATDCTLDFTTAPAKAIPLALQRAGLTIRDVSAFEINEAFASVSLANARLLGIDPEMVNLRGGAVALGHPLGASGARVTGTLARQLAASSSRYGVAAVCNGGGGATAIVLERQG